MHPDRERVQFLLPLFIASLLLAMPTWCAAQWVPNPGEGTVSFGFQYTKIGDHLFSHSVQGLGDPSTGYAGGPDNHWYLGDIYGRTATLTANIGIWRGLALSGGIAYLTSKYSGKAPESPTDDGHYHGGYQDLSLTLEYMIPWKEFAITPSVGGRFPTRGYSTLGHASVGKDLREFPIGVSVGRSLDPLLPRAYLSVAFEYSFVENHHEHSLDQRHFDWGAGYVLSNKVSLGGSMEYVNTIDGIDWYSDDFSGVDTFHDHDAAAKAKALRAGGYVSYSLARDFGLTVSYVGTLSGENTHAGRSLTIAPSWKFHTPLGK